MLYRKRAVLIAAILLAAVIAAFLFGHKEERVRLLYAVSGDSYDRAAYLNFEQSLLANAEVRRHRLQGMTIRQLRRYDAVYLDISLKQTQELSSAIPHLTAYVEQGGHLFVENGLLPDMPKPLLGVSEVTPAAVGSKPVFGYPETSGNLRGLQNVFRQFASNFTAHIPDLNEEMPGFDWGYTLVPSEAQTIVTVDGQAAYTVNRYGKGTVFAAGAFLPNRYFITGFDLQSGMDPDSGFPAKAARHNETTVGQAGRPHYFDFKIGLPQQPYFNFSFAAANYLFRSEYLAFVSKETLGYSVKKVLGPYGRPAMAFQNHFEALPAFEHQEGIAWAELLKEYNLLPTFSLVRSAFEWHRWYEGIIVHLNIGTNERPQFAGEQPNSFYSSGTHLMSGNQLLTLAAYPGKRELAVKLELPYRAYPALADLNDDGRLDLVVGSSDGYLYRYLNIGPQPSTQFVPEGLREPDSFAEPDKLLLPSGEPFRTAGHTTVAAHDLNGDGLTDLITGSEDGSVSMLLGLGKGEFAAPQPLLAAGVPIRSEAHSAPAAGDLDGDGVPDLVIGEANGQVTLYKGVAQQPLQFAAAEPLFRAAAGYAAPAIRDMNGDGKADLVVGNSEGDLLVYWQTAEGWAPQGPIQGETANPMGSHALVGGQYSVPLWADLNHDGIEDLIVGHVEYSKPVPLDDPNFPFKEQLQAFLDYAADNKLEIIPHVHVHNYLSPEQEKRELELQKQMFAALGLPWGMTGTNQHTWRISHLDRLQTLRSENEAGIWFNFGFKPSHSPTEPQWGRDFLWSFPFLLDDGRLQSPMLLDAPEFVLRQEGDGGTADIYESYAALDMPVNYFEHIEYHYNNPEKQTMLREIAEFFDRLRTAYDYNFMTEPQMARSYMAALTSRYRVERSWIAYVVDAFKNRFGRGKHLTLSISADTRGVPELAAEYRETAGVLFEPGERFEGHPFAADTPVFAKKDGKLYIGLGFSRRTEVKVDWSKEPFHIVRSNVPLSIEKDGRLWTIRLGSDGMQQIKLYSPAPLNIEGDDLRIEHDSEHGTYTVTRYGEAARIVVTVPE